MRQFTLEEALAALPDVARHAERMVNIRAALLATEAPALDMQAAVTTNGSGSANGRMTEDLEEIHRLRADLMAEVDALEQIGVLVKDIAAGLVDFPAQHPASGAPIFLCWQVGEESIGFWHEQTSGFAGRRPLPFG